MKLAQHIGAIEHGRFGPTKSSIQKVAREFEGLLITQLLKVMRQSVPESGLLGGGSGKSIYQSMFDEQIAKSASEGQGFGLAGVISESLGVKNSTGAGLKVHQRLMDGTWQAPVSHLPQDYSTGQRFGAERAGLRPEECFGGHCGLDLAKVTGTPVATANAGMISHISKNSKSRAGLWIEVDHGAGIKSRYMHLNSISSGLKVGQRVDAGQNIGTVGNTGTASEGAHLHFELRVQEPGKRVEHVDPENYMEIWGNTGSRTKKSTLALNSPKVIEQSVDGPVQDVKIGLSKYMRQMETKGFRSGIGGHSHEDH
jgi:murein DD-endopeptidase MepM/ murein hydrolase activator NlpD